LTPQHFGFLLEISKVILQLLGKKSDMQAKGQYIMAIVPMMLYQISTLPAWSKRVNVGHYIREQRQS
jgi:hypothetical protein